MVKVSGFSDFDVKTAMDRITSKVARFFKNLSLIDKKFYLWLKFI